VCCGWLCGGAPGTAKVTWSSQAIPAQLEATLDKLQESGAQRGPFMTILTVHSRLKRHLQGCVHARPYSPEKGPLRKVKVKVASRFAFTVLAIAKGSIRYGDHCALKGEEDINRFETGGSFANILLSQP